MKRSLVDEWRNKDPTLENIDGFEEFLNDRLNIVEGAEKHYQIIRELVRVVVRRYAPCLIMRSRPGLGKSYQVLETLEKEGLERKKDYNIVNSYSTPLEFYHLLWRNRKNILFLDDLEALVNDQKSLAILRSATWSPDEKRIVHYHSTTRSLYAPMSFEFEGGLIICINSLPSNPFVTALISRSLFYEFDLTPEEIFGVMSEMARKPHPGTTLEERLELVNFIEENSTPQVELRVMSSGLKLLSYAKQVGCGWKPLVKAVLK